MPPSACQDPQPDADHRCAPKNGPDKLREDAVRKARGRHLRQKGGGQNVAEARQRVTRDQTFKVAIQHQRYRRLIGAMQFTRTRQMSGDERDQQQRQRTVGGPGHTGRDLQRMQQHAQQAADKNAAPWPGKNGGRQPCPSVTMQLFIAPGRDQHHRPAAGPANQKADCAMQPWPAGEGGKQGQDHCAPHARLQPQLDPSVRPHRIKRAAQIAQIVKRGDQAGAGKRQLVCLNHQRHLGRKGKAANPHSHK